MPARVVPDDENARDLSLVECIALAQADFGSLPLDKKARIVSDKGSYEYEYISEGSLMARVRELLSPMGVAVFVSTSKVEPGSGGVYVHISIIFAKGEDIFTITGAGYGQDNRDKAYNKALTSAVRTTLTKTFLQGGDLDPEQTINERAAPRADKLDDKQLKRLTQKAIDSKIVTADGALDPKLLCRIATYVAGKKISRIDEIPGNVFVKMVDGVNNKPPALDGFAANPEGGMDAILAKEAENGW